MSSTGETSAENTFGHLHSHDSLATEEVHFRKVEGNRLVKLGRCCTIVDIHLLDMGAQDYDRDQDQRLLTFVWNDLKLSATPIFTQLQFNISYFHPSFQESLRTGLQEDNFNHCRKFVANVYKEYKAMVIGVIPKTTLFEVVHEDECSLQNMLEGKNNLKHLFKDLVFNCTKTVPEVSLDIVATGDAEYLRDNMDAATRDDLERQQSYAEEQSRSLATSYMRSTGMTRGSSQENQRNIGQYLRTGDSDGAESEQLNQILSIVTSIEEDLKRIKSKPTKRPPSPSPSTWESRRPLESQMKQLQLEVRDPNSSSPSSSIRDPGSDFDSETKRLHLEVRDADSSSQSFVEQEGGNKADSEAKSLEVFKGDDAVGDYVKSLPKLEYKPACSDQTSADQKKLTSPSFRSKESSSPVTAFSPDRMPVQMKEGTISQGMLTLIRQARGGGDGEDPQILRLIQAVETAKIDDVPVPPRADSLDTILCLDASESMRERLEDAKRIAHTFVDGLEDIAEQYGLEENVAVVRISDYACVIQHLTNDFTRVRDAIDSLKPQGRSPFFEALMVCLASLQGKGRVVNVAGFHKIRPRVLFITDGKPTDEAQWTGPDNDSGRMSHKLPIIRLVTDFGSKKHDKTPNPIIWIPVGEDADKEFLKSLATLGNGLLADEKDIPKLCRYYRIQEGIGKVASCVLRDKEHYENVPGAVEAVAEGLLPNLLPEDKRDIVVAVNEKIKTHKSEGKPDDFEDIYEDVKLFPPLGSRVIRGPDWMWKNQDTEGPGTIINHNRLDKWLWVKWDNGEQNVYRYGEEGNYDVLLADGLPRIPDSDDIQIGVRVTRGPHWYTDDEDGGQGRTGVVIRKRGRAEVKVRWDNGNIKRYKYGLDDVFELHVCDPNQFLPEPPIPEHLLEPDPPKPPKIGTLRRMSNEHIVWQWQDEVGQWRLYPESLQTKISNAFDRRKGGSCLVSKDGHNYRIMFNNMSERAVEGDTRHNVQRLSVTEEELKAMKEAERHIHF
ncbi:uncharacterized protein LOC124131401 [Haliotis rufescens]|uniref:uncharacterized protein LOC124131401 n=1 Tax=Haliotis rufescens TaxID=6454 RepID=UPI00201E878D|nr:uncharacterized protein LOC124131401 [Haliotis rufescens]XP_046350622.2 uncharacterized protein LOC124131401 [Haliotis rufescens]